MLSPSSQPRLQLRPGLAGLRAVLSAGAEGVVRKARAQGSSQTCPHTPAPPQGSVSWGSVGVLGAARRSGLFSPPLTQLFP